MFKRRRKEGDSKQEERRKGIKERKRRGEIYEDSTLRIRRRKKIKKLKWTVTQGSDSAWEDKERKKRGKNSSNDGSNDD